MFREVIINPVMNGFEMTINLPEGPQELVFNGLEDLLNELKAYYKDPDAAEDGYRQHPHARHLIAREGGVDLPTGWSGGSATASEQFAFASAPPQGLRFTDTPRPR